MAKFIRYALATVCFAASVGCLAFWWRSVYYWDTYEYLTQSPNCGQILQTVDGMAVVEFNHTYKYGPEDDRTFFRSSYRANGQLSDRFEKHGRFYVRGTTAHFPLWYPALIFALAGVAALRFRRQFSIRSALICVSVVAALLGMMVAL
jgi:hypothetical protein